MKGVSIKDIAKELNLSYTAVCKVLNNDSLHRSSKETRQLILNKAKKMGYDFSQLRYIRKRRKERIEVNIPAEIIIRSANGKRIFDKGKITIKDMSESGTFITNIKLDKNCLPAKPFICELRIFGGKFKGINLKGEPVRIGNNENLYLGLALADVPEEYRNRIAAAAS